MGYPIISVVFDEKKVATKTKTGLVQIRMYYKHQRKFISTNVKVFSDQWSDKTFVKGRSDALALNDQINDTLNKVRDCSNECVRQSGDFFFDKFTELYDVESHTNVSFINFMFDRMYKRNIKRSTLGQHEVCYNKLKQFALIQTFKDVTLPNVIKFEDWLKASGNRQTSVNSRIRILKTYISEACRMGYIDKDPTMNVHFERGKARTRRYLTPEELRKVASVELHGVHERARDVFMFMCYTSLSYADAQKFDFHRDCFLKDGKYMFRDTRTKTDEEYFIVLIPQAMELLKKYDYSLPKYSNGRINDLLNAVAIMAGLNKELTCHVARHTAACLALNNGVRIEVVSRMLGHSNINTTQIYAKMLSKEVEDAYDKVASVWDNMET